MVCKLKRKLYGLKQAPRKWYLKFDRFMLENGYKICHKNHCWYHKNFDDGYTILLLYIDDMLVACSSIHKINNVKKQLSKEFEMEFRAVKQILGMRITRDKKNHELRLSQVKYVESCLADSTYKMQSQQVPHQLVTVDSLKTKKEKDYIFRVPYASTVSSLMYVMVKTRLDIAQEVEVVSKFMTKSKRMH